MKIAYIDWTPKAESLRVVNTAAAIIREYREQGYILTLRQLYYQFVSRDLIENTERSYKNLGKIIAKARMAGLISWDAIEDRGRGLSSFWYDEDETNAIRDLPEFIRFDRWERLGIYVEVWVEKEALGNVVSRACEPFFVPHLSCKGYLSASEAWVAGRRFRDKMRRGHECFLLHLGDHDPSGIDMTRDNRERVDLFSESLGGVTVKRLALNMDQVLLHSPPPNPAKITDSRADAYIDEYGPTSWELDALEPSVIAALLTEEIQSHIDPDIWEEVEQQEEEKKAILRKLHDRWADIKETL